MKTHLHPSLDAEQKYRETKKPTYILTVSLRDVFQGPKCDFWLKEP